MRLPKSSERLLLVGGTGGGKSVAALWHLSNSNFLSAPWLVFNHKNEESINSIPGANFLALHELPKKPGIFVYTPKPDKDDDEVDNLLWRVHAQGKTGVWIDEGYMISPRSAALNSLYTQGRSLKIPMLTLSQRPSQISRFAVSESSFYQIFYLVDKRDRDTLKAFVTVPDDKSLDEINKVLPEYHSMYYDVAKRKFEILRPVPTEDIIMQNIEDRFSLSKTKNRLI